MKPKVTIIVPIYNVEKYIEKCLRSLLAQSFSEFEVWAIDDGSPDNSSDIVKEFCKKDSRIKLIQKENGGYGSVLEYAIKRIETEYFLICDPDDWLEENALETLYKNASDNKLDIVVADKYDHYSLTNEKMYSSFAPSNYKIEADKVYTTSLEIQKFAFGYVSPHAKLYKTIMAKNIEFPRKVSFTDYLLFIVALSKAKSIMYVNQPLADYLIDRPGNTTTAKNKKKIEDLCTVWDSTFNQIKDTNQSILMYRMFTQLKFILLEIYKLNPVLISTYNLNVYTRANILKKYYKEILKVIPNFEQKIIFRGIESKYLQKIFVKLFFKLKQKDS